MKRYLLFLIILLFSIIIAQSLKDKNEPDVNKTQISEFTQITDTIDKTTTLTQVIRKGWSLGYAEGLSAGNEKNQIGWFISGCAGGALGCGIGGGIVCLVASATGDIPYFIPEGDSFYKIGYLEGYRETSKPKRESYAYKGCIVGSVFFTVVAVILLEVLSDLPSLNP